MKLVRGTSRALEAGFTLVELMVVVAVIAVIAGIAVPNLVAARAAASERAVLASMRTLVTAQTQARVGATLDLNGDGQGEALALQELSGNAIVRGTTSTLQPPLLSASQGLVDVNGYVKAHGYLMALYLPDAAGQGLCASAANLPSVDANMAACYWTCLAWPNDNSTQGGPVYFVNQSGQIMYAKNTTYIGTTSVPQGGAALLGVPPDWIATSQVAQGVAGADGNVWRAIE
jgi:prepilin-type N-terminal cleavage/methylation domain-containing protein